MREQVYKIIQFNDAPEGANRAYNQFIMIVAVISVVPMMFKEGELSGDGLAIVRIIDISTVLVLILDYFMRWMTYDLDRERRGLKAGARSFVIYPFTITAIVDMLAILPTITPVASSLIFLRLLRLFKVFRASKNLHIVGNVLVNEGRTLISVFSVVGLFIFLTGLILYLAEPTTFGTFIDALYWATSALTTIGYGDYHPQSDIGQLVNAFSAIAGIIVLAIPTGIIAAGYVAEIQRQRDIGIHDNRAIDVNRTIIERIVESAVNAKNKLAEKRRNGHTLKETLSAHPKVIRYIVVMLACTIFSCTFSIIQKNTGFVYDLDLLGPAVAAFYLEPAAGIFVGFASTMFECMGTQQISYIVFLGDSCLISVIFGALLNRNKAITAKKFLLAVLLLVFALIALQTAEYILANWSGETSTSWLLTQISAAIFPNENVLGTPTESLLPHIAFYIVVSCAVSSLMTFIVIGPYLIYKHTSTRNLVCVDLPEHSSKQAQENAETQETIPHTQACDLSTEQNRRPLQEQTPPCNDEEGGQTR